MTHQRFARRWAIAIALIAFLVAPSVPLWAAEASGSQPQGQMLRIGIDWGKSSLTVTADGGFSVVDEKTGQMVVQSATSLVFSGSAGGILIADYGRYDGPLTLTAALGADNYLAYSATHYRGSFEIAADSAGQLTLINVLPIEDYLLGVVAKEMLHNWPIEAYKAQAVAARTYAMANLGKWVTYDIRDTTDDQVYGGLEAETPVSSEAVVKTAGEVATYAGKLITTPFCGSSGGYTESNENVWSVDAPSPAPWTRGVPDPFDKDNKWSHWSVALTMDQIQASLAAAGHDVGTLYEVTPEGPTESGRWVWVTVRGSKKTERLSSNAFRTYVGAYTLPSTRFTMVAHDAGLAEVEQSYDSSATPTILGADGQSAAGSLSGASVIGASGTTVLGANGEATWIVLGKQMLPAGLTFDGSGWGHGVGMSQWGAYGMANQGYSYQDILKHYYTGIEIVNITAPAAAPNEPQQ